MTKTLGLGPLPESWRTERCRWILSRRRRAPRPEDGVVTAFRDGIVTLRTNRRIDGFTEAVQEIGYQGIRRGDLVVHSMDGFAGAIGISDSDGKASPVVHAYQVSHRADPRYVAYALRIMAKSGYIEALAKGIRERSTSFDAATLANVEIPLPPVIDQRKIADFLDAEIAQIDAIIELSSNQIEALKEYRISAISGLIKSEEYKYCRLGYLTSMVTSGPRGWGEYISHSGALFFRSANLRRDSLLPNLKELAYVEVPSLAKAEAARSRIGSRDILIGITGANTGWVSIANERVAGGNVSQHVCLIRPGPQIDQRWLATYLASTPVQEYLFGGQYGGTKTQLSLGDIRDVRVPLVSLSRQESIAAEARRIMTATENSVEHLRARARLLAERRQAIIAAAVTGQIDVTTGRGADLS